MDCLTSPERQSEDVLDKNLHWEISVREGRPPPEVTPFVGVPGALALSADCRLGVICFIAKTAVSAVFVCGF